MSSAAAQDVPASSTATAAVLHHHTKPLELSTVAIAEVRPDEVRIRMVGAGICHTDLGVIATITDEESPIVLGMKDPASSRPSARMSPRWRPATTWWCPTTTVASAITAAAGYLCTAGTLST